MPRSQSILFGVAALVAGGAASWMLASLVAGYEERIEAAKRPPVKVYVAAAARDLYPGLPIAEGDLYAIQMRPEYLPDGVFLDPEYVVGRIPRERVLANELVRGERLSDPSSNQGLNVVVPRGLRALSVSIHDGAALAGFLNPGTLVDVLVTVKDPETEREETTTLLQAVYVLGVDSRMGSETADEARARRGTHSPTVTLLVDPSDAERVTHADWLGDLRLTMRTGNDAAVVKLDPPKAEKVARPKAAKVEAPVLPVCKEVWLWHGAQRVVLVVDDHGRPAEPGTCTPQQ